MTSAAAKPKSPAALTLAAATAAGGASTAPEVQSGFQTTSEGRSAEAFCSPDSHKGTNAGVGKQLTDDTLAGHTGGPDQVDHKEAIISVLEDWAEWERALEIEANDEDVVTSPQRLPIATAHKPEESLPNSWDGKTSHHALPSTHFAEIDNSGIHKPHIGKRKMLSTTYPAGDSTQLLYSSRRERRRAEKNDPIARARRQALKIWAADQTRRRSSGEPSNISESLNQHKSGLLRRELAMANAKSRRRSSADITVDHNRKSGELSLGNESLRRKKPPFHASVPRGMSFRHDVLGVYGMRPDQRQSLRKEAPDAGLELKEALTKPRLKRRNSHPWRENMKALEECTGRPSSNLAPRGVPPASASTPRASTIVASSSTSSMVTGRGSPWARSPSRETAGGILVKHCFFYGSASKASTTGGVAAALRSPTFESPWMRHFREEVERNPNWWAGSDQFVVGRATTSYSGNGFSRTKGVGGALLRPVFPAAGGSSRGRGGKTDRATDLWKEVRALLATGKHGSNMHLRDGKPTGDNANAEGVPTTDSNDYLSFGDRLRCTPLSQGAWLLGSAAVTAAPAASPGQQESQSVEELLAADANSGAAAKTGAKCANGADSEGGVVTDSKRVATNSASDDPPVVQQIVHRDEETGKTGGNCGKRVARGNEWRDLQSIHATTLAKLRGEIDPITREELVLRAAEEARGALARDRARSTSPRRSSVGVFRPWSKERKRASVPDSIDYDKVEATLSLIDLASRAAGPDAGKQMLHALQGLDKIHQRVVDENNSGDSERGGLGSSKDPTSVERTALGDDGELQAAKQSGDSAQRATRDEDASKENVSVGDQREVSIGEISSVKETTKEVREGGFVTAAEAIREKGGQPNGGRALAVENDSTTPVEDGPLSETGAEGEASAADHPPVSRKLSLALSSSSEESAKSEASSVGVMQTIGNWLWASPSPEHSRRNSQSSETNKEQEGGRSEFPLPRKGSEPHSPEDVEAKTLDEEALSNNAADSIKSTLDRSARSHSASQREGSAVVDQPLNITNSDAERIAMEEPQVGKQDGQGDTSCEQQSSTVSIQPSEHDESSPSLRQGTLQSTAVDMWNPTDQDPLNNLSISLERVSSRARRSSEADKPTGLPHLASEIARVEGLVTSVADHRGEIAGKQLENEDTQVQPNEVGNPSNSLSHFLSDVIGSEDFKPSVDSRRRESKAGIAVTTAEEQSTRRAEKAVDGGNVDVRGESWITPHPNHTKIAEFAIGPTHPESPLVTTTMEHCDCAAFADTAAKKGINNEELRHTQIAMGKTDAAAEAGSDKRVETAALLHRDSWMSVGTRPRRGKNAAMVQTTIRAADTYELQEGEMTGRPALPSADKTASTADSRGSDRAAKQDATTARWESRKVSVKFVWPKPGSIDNPKRLRPPEERKTTSASPLSGAPGIVRRSPLIDALHPEVSRQREFRRKLRQTHHLREATSASAVAATQKSCGEGATYSAGRDAERRRKGERLAAAAARNVSSNSMAARSTTAQAKAKEKARRSGGTDGTQVEARTHSRRRSRWSEPVPLPDPPLSAAPLPSSPSPVGEVSRPLPPPSETKAPDSGKGPSSLCAAFSGTGCLTVAQWGHVEEWLAGARRYLGENAWACLGLSAAFSRTLTRLKQSAVQGDRSSQITSTSPVATSLAAKPGGLQSSPVREGTKASSQVGLVKSAEAVHGSGEGRRGQHGESKNGGSPYPQKSRAQHESLANDQTREEKANIDERKGPARGWDGALFEKTALAIDAVIWTVAAEREIIANCESISRKSPRSGGENRQSLPGQMLGGQKAQHLASPATEVSTAAVVELRISLPTARRYVKGSRLVDGVYVLDADVDLAFKRWEEAERLPGPASPDAFLAASPVVVDEEANGRDGNGKGMGCGVADAAVRVSPKQMLCEAVGCSDPARYGDIHPTATVKLCRKHRRNGMVDLGSRRCDRPGCGRLAVGGIPNRGTRKVAVCTLHSREGRVGVEGLTFVLLALSKARHTRTRRMLANLPATTAETKEQALPTHTCGEEERATQNASVALYAAAVSNVLLAVTQQPLMPGFPAMGRHRGCRPRTMEGSRRSDSPIKPKPPEDSFTSSIDSIRTRPSDGPTSAAPAAAMTAYTAAASSTRVSSRSQQQGGRRCVRSSGCHNRDDKTGVGSINWHQVDALEIDAVGGVGHRPSKGEAAAAAAAAAPRVSAVSKRQEYGEEEDQGRSSEHVRPGERWQSPPPQQQEIIGEQEDRLCLQVEPGGVVLGGGAAGGSEEVTEQGRPRGEGQFPVSQVLSENFASLRAVFHKFARQSPSAGEKGADMTMSLSDILRFCDAFELRPGLVSTREILDTFKEVAYPGVVGLTDEEVGFSDTAAGASTAQAVQTSTMRSGAINAPRIDPVSPDEISLRPRSSPSKIQHPGVSVFPASEKRAGGKDCREPPAFDETAALDATLVGDHAVQTEAALQDLTLHELATASTQAARGEVHKEGGSETTTAARRELSRMESESTRGTLQRESSSSSSFSRGAGSRRGTAQQEDDECSLYFKSDSGVEGQHRMRSPSRRASSASSSSRGGVSGRGKRTVYLGRTQVFPLRRVESSLAADARGFGLSGARPDTTATNCGGPRRRTSTLGLSTMQRRSSSLRSSGTCYSPQQGNFDSSAGGAAFDHPGGPSTTAASGLTETQFFQWLTEVAAGCKVLTTKKTLGCSVTRRCLQMGRDDRKRKQESRSFVRTGVRRREKGTLNSVSPRQDAARAIVLLQWMEVSRGMKAGNQEGIPPFRISSSLAKRAAKAS